MPLFHHDNPMASPLGEKLRARGYSSFWDFLEKNGFTDLESFKSAIGFPSLIPIGFYDFLDSSAKKDGRFNLAVRVAASDFLNDARIRYSVKSPSENWMVIHPVSKVASQFKPYIAWVDHLMFTMRDYLLNNRQLFDREFSYDDAWMVEMVDAAAASYTE